MQSAREFSLAKSEGDGRRPYLNEKGAFLGLRTPLLDLDALGRWKPRPKFELDALLNAAYRGRVALGPIAQSLATVANALNKGDRGLAAIALVQAELPAMPDFDTALATAKLDLALLKYNPNWSQELREPAHASQGRGGQWTNDPSTLDAADFQNVVYRGYRHNELVRDLASYLRNRGIKVETELPLTGLNGVTARADIVFQRNDTGALCIVEVKTGDDPTFTDAQRIVYPLALLDRHVFSPSPQIKTFGFALGEPLPAFELYSTWERPDGTLGTERIPLQSLLEP